MIPLKPSPSIEWDREWHELMQDDWLRKKLDRERRLQEHEAYLREMAPELWDRDESDRGKMSVIDVGPGAGETLEIVESLGYEGYGIDASTGEGGMGDAYLKACELMSERQEVLVVRDGWFGSQDWLDGYFKDSAILLNFRGSFEQVMSRHMNGVPHEVHHDCKQLKWKFGTSLTLDVEGVFSAAEHVIVKGGVLAMWNNGTAEDGPMDMLLDRIGRDFPFEHVLNERNKHRWIRR